MFYLYIFYHFWIIHLQIRLLFLRDGFMELWIDIIEYIIEYIIIDDNMKHISSIHINMQHWNGITFSRRIPGNIIQHRCYRKENCFVKCK